MTTSHGELIPTVFTLFLTEPIYRKIIFHGKTEYHQLCDSINIELRNNEKMLYGIYTGRSVWNTESQSFEYESFASNRTEESLKFTRFTLEKSHEILKEILSLYNMSHEQFINKDKK